MKHILCTIQTLSDPGEDCWIITVPVDSVNNAAAELTALLSGSRRRVVFLDRKTECTVTADSVIFNSRQVPITRTWLECLEKLFSTRHTTHIDYDFSDRHGDVTITVFIK